MTNPLAKSGFRGITLIVAAATMLGMTGCAGGNRAPAGPPIHTVVDALDAGLESGDLSGVTFVQPNDDVVGDYKVVVGGMDGYTPQVHPGEVTYQHIEGEGDAPDEWKASIPLTQRYSFAGHDWQFDSTAEAFLRDGEWKVRWDPSLIHPSLDGRSRLRHTRTVPERAPILDRHGKQIVSIGQVVQVGIDKTRIDATRWDAQARKLAAIVDVDPDSFAQSVTKAGAKDYVVAIVYRQGAVPEAVHQVEGTLLRQETRPLTPYREFATGLIGSVGPASAADIKRIQAGAGTRPESETNSASASQSPSQSASESGSTTGSIPDVEAGDLIGTNGIQGIYDEQLRGKPGHTVTLVERKHPSELNPDRVTLSEPVSDQDLFTVAAVNGTPLKLSLDLELQTMVEKRLSNTIRGSFVMIDLATGGVVAAADSGDARATADSAQGHFPPGSTFKLVVSLALLRQGFTPDTPVQCPETTTVNGMVFRNYSGYPSAKLGTITFADALAESCNTAFIEAATKNLSIEQIQEAAASLGFGVDFSMGYPSFFGSLASTDQPTKFAADAIGQGDVLASPLAMAGVAASVASGKTVVGWMVEGRTAPVTAKPLTQDEAKSLQKMAAGVVSSGTATSLKGILVGAKTGTAEYQSAEGIETHGWMIGYNDKYAVAAFVFTGVSGSGDAGPLVKDILQGNP